MDVPDETVAMTARDPTDAALRGFRMVDGKHDARLLQHNEFILNFF
jgi:hypothetical protein